jgi:hypothetical protein
MSIKKLITTILIAATTIAGLLASTLVLPPNTAYAQSVNAPEMAITRTPAAPLLGDAAKAALSNYFKREQNGLNVQSTHLQRADDIAVKAQQFINTAKAEGKDVSVLETALGQYDTYIAQAQSTYDTAAAIISAHSGFDENGNVTDMQAARQTVGDARQNLRSAHISIVQAVRTLQQAILQWRMTY